MLTCNSLPYLQTTLGFGRYESLVWANGATTSSLMIDTDTTISATVIYSPTCIVDDKRTFTFEDHINQAGIVDHISCYGMNDGSIQLNIEDVDSNFNQTWIYPNNQTGGRNTQLNSLTPGTYTSIISVPGYENICSDTAQFIVLEPTRLTVSLDTTIAGKCSDPDGTIMITSAGGAGTLSYHWNNEEITEDNLKAWGGYNEVTVTDTNHCTAQLSLDMLCIEHINIPELITPNGDGFGDEWEIIDLLRLYPDNDVKIINRWGNTVYHKQAYSNEFTGISNAGGTLSKGYLPSGTYFYIIDLGAKYKTLTGYVELVY
jgi:gliding motility-associated-like protein